MEVNGLCGNETTLPLIQNSGDEQANTQLWSADNTTKKADSVHYNKSLNNYPPWNCLGAKPKSKSCLLEVGGREIDWPSLPMRQRSSSTPVHGRKQDWTSVNGKVNNKPPKQPIVKLQNRFAPLSKGSGSLLDDHPSQSSKARTENLLKRRES